MDQMGRVLGKLLADLLSIKSEGIPNEASELVNTVFEKEIGFDFDEIIKTKPEDLLQFLFGEKKFDEFHIEHIANILFELGSEPDKSIDEKQLYFSRAEVLYNWLNSIRKVFSFDFMLKLNAMKNELK